MSWDINPSENPLERQWNGMKTAELYTARRRAIRLASATLLEIFPGHPVGDVAPHDGGHEQDDAGSNGVER